MSKDVMYEINGRHALLGVQSFSRRKTLRVEGGIPRFVYRYLGMRPNESNSGISDIDKKKFEDIALHSKLWLSAPCDFNDPYDFRVRIDLPTNAADRRKWVERVVRRVRKRSGLDKGPKSLRRVQRDEDIRRLMRDIEERAKQSYESLRSSIGICCFSENARSVSMWSLYATNHTGVCLQFATAADIDVFALMGSVNYTDDFPVARPADERQFEQDYCSAVHAKSREWLNEKERRFVRSNSSNEEIPFEPAALTGIIFALNSPLLVTDYVKSVLERRNAEGHPRPKLYRALLATNSYRMKIGGDSS